MTLTRSDFPGKLGSLQDAREFWVDFFAWYNDEHRHSGLGMLTPAEVHHGHAEIRLNERRVVLNAAYNVHPERFPHGRPTAGLPQREVWINRPSTTAAQTNVASTDVGTAGSATVTRFGKPPGSDAPTRTGPDASPPTPRSSMAERPWGRAALRNETPRDARARGVARRGLHTRPVGPRLSERSRSTVPGSAVTLSTTWLRPAASCTRAIFPNLGR